MSEVAATAPGTGHASDLALQDRLLPGVSRTFALTIPQLPGTLRVAVGNAYLLCRIADTIEDDEALSDARRRRFHERFILVLGKGKKGRALAEELAGALASATPAERRLIGELPAVVRITSHLPPARRDAIVACVRIMCDRMPHFQRKASHGGLATLRELESYCYVVAGAVGEMLTALFCDHRRKIAARRQELMALAPSFGQALQLTNILKDFWEDRARGICWIPRELFERHGVDHRDTGALRNGAMAPVLHDVLGIAHACLARAMAYVQALPRREIGIRRFCLWATGLSALTLRNLKRQPDYGSADDVKVSRLAVRGTVIACNALASSNAGLSLAFRACTAGLPLRADYELPQEVADDRVTGR